MILKPLIEKMRVNILLKIGVKAQYISALANRPIQITIKRGFMTITTLTWIVMFAMGLQDLNGYYHHWSLCERQGR